MKNIISDQIVLTIGIPTYNGSLTIEKTLKSIVPQLTPQIEILISDNCSEDETESIIRKYTKTYKNVNYIRNSQNIGFDRNVDALMNKSSGGMVWILGDDDYLMDGAVENVLKIIDSNPNVEIIFANCPHDIKLDELDNGLCFSGNDFFKKTKFKNGFISTNIFSKKLWATVDVSKYFDSGWIHIGFLIEALQRSASYVTSYYSVDYIRSEAIEMRWGGNGSFIYTGLNLVKIYSRMKDLNYTREVTRQAYLSIKGAYWKSFPIAKAKGFKLKFNFLVELISIYKNFLTFWVIDLPIILMPSIFYKSLFFCYKKIKSSTFFKF